MKNKSTAVLLFFLHMFDIRNILSTFTTFKTNELKYSVYGKRTR